MGRHARLPAPRLAWIAELATLFALVTMLLDFRRPPGRRRATRRTPPTTKAVGAVRVAQHRRPSPRPRALTRPSAGQ